MKPREWLNSQLSLLSRGTTRQTAPQIAESVEALGGSLSSSADWDGAYVTLSSLSSSLNDALPTFAEVLRSPAFASEEVERFRSETLDDLTVNLRSPGTLAIFTAARVVFGDSGYGHLGSGTPETVKALNAGQIHSFYAARYQPQNASLIFGGDINPETAFAYAEKHFGDWKSSSANAGSPPQAVSILPGRRVLVVDKPDAGQAAVFLVRPTIRRGDKNYPIGRVADAVFGEGYSSRLNREIRIKRGLSYGASSSLAAHKYWRPFSPHPHKLATRRRNRRVATLMKSELTRMAVEPVAVSEIIPRKASLSGNYARRLETGGRLGFHRRVAHC